MKRKLFIVATLIFLLFLAGCERLNTDSDTGKKQNNKFSSTEVDESLTKEQKQNEESKLEASEKDNQSQNEKDDGNENDTDNTNNKMNETKNAKAGTYSDGTITVEIVANPSGTYQVNVIDEFHDKFYDLELVNNSLFIERRINPSMMPEAEFPYDEITNIIISWGELNEGVFTHPALNYHRNSEIIIQTKDPENPTNTIMKNTDTTLKRKN